MVAVDERGEFCGFCDFFVVFEGFFEDFFCGFWRIFMDFLWFLEVLRIFF